MNDLIGKQDSTEDHFLNSFNKSQRLYYQQVLENGFIPAAVTLVIEPRILAVAQYVNI